MIPQVEIRPACPKCSSDNTHCNGKQSKRFGRRVCRECGNSWNYMVISAAEIEVLKFSARISVPTNSV